MELGIAAMFEWRKQSKDSHDEFEFLRRNMVARQIRDRGIRDPRVLSAMLSVPRHAFVPIERISDSYADAPLPIGERQTISQPFMVAAMASALLLKGNERVLEIGAGSGYQAAVLSLLAREVIAIEARTALATTCRERLARLGYSNVDVIEGDGSAGCIAYAPYDAILVSAAAPSIPQPLFDQLREGGRVVAPVGGAESQQVLRVVKCGGEPVREGLYHCRFVPLVGTHGWRDSSEEVANG
jgi:protein-L-isoaspartate(D-aspartate) O-methyltransferase